MELEEFALVVCTVILAVLAVAVRRVRYWNRLENGDF